MDIEEKPFGPTAKESLLAVVSGIVLIVFIVVSFILDSKCRYETGKAFSDHSNEAKK